ncbi:MAG: DUF4230 domain-containing protein [bacterium]
METALIIILTVVATLAVAAVLKGKLQRRDSARHVDVQSGIQNIRAIGQLSVFKAFTKEIVTETDHSWGDFGKKYLSWMLSMKKMAMIFEFEIDFRYDLRRPEFDINAPGGSSATIRMPPCFYEVRIRNIQFYDEQKSKLLPWLLPDLLNGFLADGFTEEDKNRLVAAAKHHAEAQARALIGNLQSEVQTSAKATLQSLARAFGVDTVLIEFVSDAEPAITVNVATRAAA